MHKFLRFFVVSLCSLWFSSGFVYAQETLYYVQIIGNGGRILQEKGPFGDYFDAQEWAVVWGVGNPRNLRLWKIVERKTEKPKIPLDQVMAQGVERLEYLITKTKKVAKYSGMKIPSAGDVTGEYKQNIENSYQSAKALRDKMSEFAENAPRETLGKMDALVTEITQVESERLVMTQEAKFAKEVANFTETQAKEKRKDIREALDRIANATDPAERQRLTDELKELQKSGQLKEAVLAEANYQNHQDHYKTTQKTLKEMEKSVAEHKTQMEEIVESMRIRPVGKTRERMKVESPVVGRWTGTATLGVGKSYASTDEAIYVFNEDHTGTWDYLNSNGQTRGTIRFTWEEQGNSVILQFEPGRERTLQRNANSMFMRIFTNDDFEVQLMKSR